MSEDLSVLTRKANPPDLTVAYGSDPEQVGDIRYGQRGAQLPLLVLVHGGFWKPQYDRAHAEAMSSALAAAGWTVLTLEYRRIPGQPDATLRDVAVAIETLPTMLKQHNGKLLLVGHSAGGHLVLWAAATCANPNLQGVVALAPAADLKLAYALHLGDDAVMGFLGADPSDRPDADPLQLPAPPVAVTIVQGATDAIVPPAVAASYCAAFPMTRLVQLPDTGHFAVIDPLSGAWPSVVVELRKLSDMC
ncbi:MAG: alpha/beta hydrolase [Pseudomonadota bacterium]